ncbi:MAG: MurR/RpiR family transcriptional regulator [Lactobacillales bacterium]|jgi:DNA-binding MurR/RpiR family transcriptional regulator|nr:MurR/RpiR family transcriptional regulator [Lactobacillales bacterium]
MKKQHLSDVENQVLEYILANIHVVVNQTIDEVAKTMFTSTATISRTAKHLGFTGFRELKYAIAEYEENEKISSIKLKNKEPNYSKLAEILHQQLLHTFEQLSQEKISEIVLHIHEADNIELLGVGGSLANCIDAARKLTFLGKKASARVDWDELRAVSHSLTKNDLAILVSHSGETIHILEYATILMERNVPMVAIVGSEDSSLESLSTYTLKAEMTPLYFGEVDLSSRISLTGLLDTLLISYAEKYQ